MNFIKTAGAIVVAAISLGSFAACGTQHEINGQVVPTDGKKVCALLADDDGLGTGVGSEDGDTFTKKQYAEYRAWAKDINDEDLSKGMLALAEFFEPGKEEETDFSDAMLIFGVYEDVSKACDDLGVELPDLMDAAMEGSGEDTDWTEPEEVAPDTEQWLAGWCDVQMGMTYDDVVQIMGEPTTTSLEGEGTPQVSYDYSGFGFTVFFDTDQIVNSFWANYDALGQSDLDKLDCVIDSDMGLDRKDMYESGF